MKYEFEFSCERSFQRLVLEAAFSIKIKLRNSFLMIRIRIVCIPCIQKIFDAGVRFLTRATNIRLRGLLVDGKEE